jgi:hypothetical protein
VTRPAETRAAVGSPANPQARLRAVTPDETGFAPLTMMLGVTLVVIPVLLLVLTIPTWLERSVDARDAAANAARALATANTWAAGTAAANQTVTELITGDGLNPSDVEVTYGGSLNPGATVTATVTVEIPAGVIPGLGHYGTVHYRATSTQHIDTFRADNGQP